MSKNHPVITNGPFAGLTSQIQTALNDFVFAQPDYYVVTKRAKNGELAQREKRCARFVPITKGDVVALLTMSRVPLESVPGIGPKSVKLIEDWLTT